MCCTRDHHITIAHVVDVESRIHTTCTEHEELVRHDATCVCGGVRHACEEGVDREVVEVRQIDGVV